MDFNQEKKKKEEMLEVADYSGLIEEWWREGRWWSSKHWGTLRKQ